MATIKKAWAAAVVLAETAKFGGSAVVVAADGKYDYTGDVDLETAGQEGAQLLIETKLNFAASRTAGAPAAPSDLIVDVFASLDATTYDTVPFMRRLLKARSDGDWQRFTLIVKDVAHFRIGLRVAGGADTYDYQITHQRWNLSNA